MTTRKSYTKSLKLEMIRRLAAGESPKALFEENGIPVRTLQEWNKLKIEQDTPSEYGSLNVVDDELRYKILKEENKARIINILEQLVKN